MKCPHWLVRDEDEEICLCPDGEEPNFEHYPTTGCPDRECPPGEKLVIYEDGTWICEKVVPTCENPEISEQECKDQGKIRNPDTKCCEDGSSDGGEIIARKSVFLNSSGPEIIRTLHFRAVGGDVFDKTYIDKLPPELSLVSITETPGVVVDTSIDDQIYITIESLSS
jgi:hypothetical protein